MKNQMEKKLSWNLQGIPTGNPYKEDHHHMRTRYERPLSSTISVSEASIMSDLSEGIIRRAVEENKIPSCFKVGARCVIPREAFEAWLKGQAGDVANVKIKAIAIEIRKMELQARIRATQQELDELEALERREDIS